MSYKEQVKKVPGVKGKEIMLFALSTCFWCKKAMTLLTNLGLEYGYVDVDFLFGSDQEEAYDEIQKYNKDISFPTIVINNGEDVIIGYDEEKLKNLK